MSGIRDELQRARPARLKTISSDRALVSVTVGCAAIKLNRPTRAPHSKTTVALIDMEFFLMVFFKLIGRMDATAAFEVLHLIAQSGRNMPADAITLAISTDGGDISRKDLVEARSERLAQAQALGLRDMGLVVTPERNE